MMKHILLFITLILLLISCGKSENEKNATETKQNVAEVKKPTGPLLNLKYKYKVGDKFS